MRWFVRFLSFLLLTSMLGTNAAAQQDSKNMSLKSISIGSGRDAIASGIVGTAIFESSDGTRFGDFTVQPQQAWLTYGRNYTEPGVKLTLGGTIGHFQSAPWIGPYVNLSFLVTEKVSITGLYWPAVFAWEPSDWKNDGVKNPESFAFGNFGMVSIGTDRVKLTYAMLDFLDDPFNRLPGISISAPYSERMTFSANSTWNTVAEEWMFYMGMTWSPK